MAGEMGYPWSGTESGSHQLVPRGAGWCAPRWPSHRTMNGESLDTGFPGWNILIRDLEHAYTKDGGLCILFGNLAEDGAVVKTAGVDSPCSL